MLRTKVKASSITNLTDARYFAAWEVEWLGFCLDPGNERYIQPQMVQALREWVDGPKITGEFGLQSAADVKAAVELLNLDAVQLSPVADMEILTDLQDSVPLLREIIVEKDTPVEDLAEQMETEQALVAAFLLNFDKNGIAWEDIVAGDVLSAEVLKELTWQYPVVLSIDLTPDGLEEVLDLLRPAGFSFRGGEEEKVGFKSFDELDALFEQLEVQV